MLIDPKTKVFVFLIQGITIELFADHWGLSLWPLETPFSDDSGCSDVERRYDGYIIVLRESASLAITLIAGGEC